jgi:hypothetical protein
MKKSKKQIKSEYKFNIEVYRDRDNKEIKISNMPIYKIKIVCLELLEKYG